MTEERARLYKQLGLTIAYHRKLRGMTQEQLAEKIDKSRTYISKIEGINTKANPSLSILIDISFALEVPLGALFQFQNVSDTLEN